MAAPAATGDGHSVAVGAVSAAPGSGQHFSPVPGPRGAPVVTDSTGAPITSIVLPSDAAPATPLTGLNPDGTPMTDEDFGVNARGTARRSQPALAQNALLGQGYVGRGGTYRAALALAQERKRRQEETAVGMERTRGMSDAARAKRAAQTAAAHAAAHAAARARATSAGSAASAANASAAAAAAAAAAEAQAQAQVQAQAFKAFGADALSAYAAAAGLGLPYGPAAGLLSAAAAANGNPLGLLLSAMASSTAAGAAGAGGDLAVRAAQAQAQLMQMQQLATLQQLQAQMAQAAAVQAQVAKVQQAQQLQQQQQQQQQQIPNTAALLQAPSPLQNARVSALGPHTLTALGGTALGGSGTGSLPSALGAGSASGFRNCSTGAAPGAPAGTGSAGGSAGGGGAGGGSAGGATESVASMAQALSGLLPVQQQAWLTAWTEATRSNDAAAMAQLQEMLFGARKLNNNAAPAAAPAAAAVDSPTVKAERNVQQQVQAILQLQQQQQQQQMTQQQQQQVKSEPGAADQSGGFAAKDPAGATPSCVVSPATVTRPLVSAAATASPGHTAAPAGGAVAPSAESAQTAEELAAVAASPAAEQAREMLRAMLSAQVPLHAALTALQSSGLPCSDLALGLPEGTLAAVSNIRASTGNANTAGGSAASNQSSSSLGGDTDSALSPSAGPEMTRSGSGAGSPGVSLPASTVPSASLHSRSTISATSYYNNGTGNGSNGGASGFALSPSSAAPSAVTDLTPLTALRSLPPVAAAAAGALPQPLPAAEADALAAAVPEPLCARLAGQSALLSLLANGTFAAAAHAAALPEALRAQIFARPFPARAALCHCPAPADGGAAAAHDQCCRIALCDGDNSSVNGKDLIPALPQPSAALAAAMATRPVLRRLWDARFGAHCDESRMTAESIAHALTLVDGCNWAPEFTAFLGTVVNASDATSDADAAGSGAVDLRKFSAQEWIHVLTATHGLNKSSLTNNRNDTAIAEPTAAELTAESPESVTWALALMGLAAPDAIAAVAAAVADSDGSDADAAAALAALADAAAVTGVELATARCLPGRAPDTVSTFTAPVYLDGELYSGVAHALAFTAPGSNNANGDGNLAGAVVATLPGAVVADCAANADLAAEVGAVAALCTEVKPLHAVMRSLRVTAYPVYHDSPSASARRGLTSSQPSQPQGHSQNHSRSGFLALGVSDGDGEQLEQELTGSASKRARSLADPSVGDNGYEDGDAAETEADGDDGEADVQLDAPRRVAFYALSVSYLDWAPAKAALARTLARAAGLCDKAAAAHALAGDYGAGSEWVPTHVSAVLKFEPGQPLVDLARAFVPLL